MSKNINYELLEFFNFIAECNQGNEKEGMEAFKQYLNDLDMDTYQSLVLQMTAVIVKMDTPFEVIKGDFMNEEEPKPKGTPHLKVVH